MKPQLLVTLNDFLKSNEQGLQTDVIIMDFSKAFDSVPDKELLHKLKHYRVMVQYTTGSDLS